MYIYIQRETIKLSVCSYICTYGCFRLACINICKCVCMYKCVSVCVCMSSYNYLCMCVYACMCKCMYVYMKVRTRFVSKSPIGKKCT